MEKNRVLLVGNCVLDQVWQLPYFPAQDEEMRAINCTRLIGGNACNSAQMLALLKNEVELVCSLAQDASSEWLLRELSTRGIGTRHCIQQPGYSTPESSIWLNSLNGSRTIAHHRNLPELGLESLQNIEPESYRWIHFEGRNIRVLKSYLATFRHPNCLLSLEIEKDRPDIEKLLPYVHVAIVSNAYLRSRKISATECLQYFRQINSALNVVCTLGADGLIALDDRGKLIEIAAQPVARVVDTIAAGDCFIAGLIHQMLQLEPFYAALDYAHKLAARKIQFQGIKLND